MIGAVAIWYAAGLVIALMVALEVRGKGKQDGSKAPRGPGITPLLWLALAAAAIIFALWPWVALNLAENTPL